MVPVSSCTYKCGKNYLVEDDRDERLRELAEVPLEHVGQSVVLHVGQLHQVGGALEGGADLGHLVLDPRHPGE